MNIYIASFKNVVHLSSWHKTRALMHSQERLLNIDKDSSFKDAKKLYHKLLLKYHPDKNEDFIQEKYFQLQKEWLDFENKNFQKINSNFISSVNHNSESFSCRCGCTLVPFLNENNIIECSFCSLIYDVIIDKHTMPGDTH